MSAERQRLKEDHLRSSNWKRWGPYLSERQWGTVREDYSEDGNCWNHFTHDQSRSRAYRWGEDGLLGISDREGRLCLALALWNTHDPILKERLFGLTGHQGNHGEDVKELYYYVDSTPTHSYMSALYKYPQSAYPYSDLVHKNAHRSVSEREYELLDTGVFDDNRYFDVKAEYCKSSPNNILCRYTISNHGADPATIHVLPTVWFRNVWSWGEDCYSHIEPKPYMKKVSNNKLSCLHPSLGINQQVIRGQETNNEDNNETPGLFYWEVDVGQDGEHPDLLFTENDTNLKLLYGVPNKSSYVKDAFHDYVIKGDTEAVNPAGEGTKCAAHYVLNIQPGQSVILRVRLFYEKEASKTKTFANKDFDAMFDKRIHEADEFYKQVIPNKTMEERLIARQAYAGLLWSKQFYYYVIKEWLTGDMKQPKPPESRQTGRNSDWTHLFNRDVISMPDKWEYPWYASWDLAFHMIPFAYIDSHFAKEQLILFLREWYMHPNGQIPAYEFSFEDVNPPVHAYSVMKVYKSGPKGKRDHVFLARCFHKLVLNFTWWINRKDVEGKNIFSGGFLGLDNIGVFDRSKPLPTGGYLVQADATAWMAFFCVIMLEMSLTLARHDPIYEDMASKFFEHFVAIVDAINERSGIGLWNEEDGFYYDHIKVGHNTHPLKILSMVGVVPLFSCLVIKENDMKNHPGFYKRTKWFLHHRKDLAKSISFMCHGDDHEEGILLAIVKKEQLVRVLGHLLNEEEFLSPYGIRSLSKHHKDKPFVIHTGEGEHRVMYDPAESCTKMFGGNSNWRGPIWFPLNYLLIENLYRYDYYYGNSLKVECPTGSGKYMRLKDVATDLLGRMAKLFLPDPLGFRPCHGEDERYAKDPNYKDLILFYEYFDGDTGRGCGASHQTGWTALIANILRLQNKARIHNADMCDISSDVD